MKRFFMVSGFPLFCEGVIALLREKNGLEFVGREAHPDRAIAQIEGVRPDVVIVDTGDVTCDASALVMRILREHCEIKIIGLNLHDNTICLFHEERHSIRGVEDLMNAIQADDPAPLDRKGG